MQGTGATDRILSGVGGVWIDGAPPRAGFAELRHWFRRVRVLRDDISSSECPLPELSMGMSRDLDAAVVEGATLVRPGSSLFGTRQP